MDLNSFSNWFSRELLIDPKEVERTLGLSGNPYVTDIRNLPFGRIAAFSEKYGVTIDEMMSLEIDFDRIKDFLSEDFINENYLVYDGTFISTITTSLEYLGRKFNYESIDYALKKLGLKRSHLIKNRSVSLFLACDVFDLFVSDFGFAKADLFKCGLNSYTESRRKSLIPAFKSCRTDIEIVRKMIESAKDYERNFSYKLVERGSVFKVVSTAYEEAHDAYRKKIISSDACNLFKAGVFVKTPTILNRPKLNLLTIDTGYKHGRQVTEYVFKKNALSNFSFLQ